MHRRIPATVAVLGSVFGPLVFAGCILPDSGIIVRSDDENESPVRFVEPTGLTLSARCACDPGACPADEPPETWNPVCPLPDDPGLPHLLDPTEPQFRFCSCALGEVDNQPLPAIELFVEDQDQKDGQPEDSLFAVLLLDYDAGQNPTTRLAYQRYLNPSEPLFSAVSDYSPTLRPDPQLRSIFIGDENAQFDLCNGNLAPLTEGWHTFTVLVTDRPWFTAEVVPEGETEPLSVQQLGVPDIAAGASFDTSEYAFFCESQADEDDPFDCASRCLVEGEG